MGDFNIEIAWPTKTHHDQKNLKFWWTHYSMELQFLKITTIDNTNIDHIWTKMHPPNNVCWKLLKHIGLITTQ
jgi:hypothetical protein